MPGKILAVDDERDLLTLLRRIVTGETDCEIVTETDPLSALELVKSTHFDIVFVDLKMPRMDGLTLLREIKKYRPRCTVVILTAYAAVDTAVEGIRLGAYDYITKPFKNERIVLTIEKVLSWQAMVEENLSLRQALAEKDGGAAMVGNTPALRQIVERIKQVGPTNATVLITGPSGTGKELVARAIHAHSLRRHKKFVTVNSTAIPEQMIESELFGHVRGAFTGAYKNKVGLVEEAHEGTIFLDEIGDLGMPLQTKLLRLVQEGEYKPVGSEITKVADLRFVAATNQNLKQAIRDKTFREDLYYRLNVIHFELPPLRERRPDIPLLSYYFLKKYAAAYQKNLARISASAMQSLMAHEFPGNVRELENIIERAVIFCHDDAITRENLFLEDETASSAAVDDTAQGLLSLPFKAARERALQDFHGRYVDRLLREHEGNISRAADAAGIQRQYFYKLMKHAGIDQDEYRQGGEPEKTEE